MPAARIFLELIADFVVYLGLLLRPRKAIAAENLFLRRQLALYLHLEALYPYSIHVRGRDLFPSFERNLRIFRCDKVREECRTSP
jgi:hypothetical protein